MAVRRELLFPTPLLIDRVDAPEANAALEAAILARRAADPGIDRSNQGGGWHSDLDLLRWATAPVTPMVQAMIAMADAATHDMQAIPGRRRGWSLEGWANVNPPGAGNVAHSHGGTYWAAVYYVRVDPGDGGELVLADPRLPAIEMHAPALRFADIGSEGAFALKPETGMVVLFPAWLSHSVLPWHGEGLRISVAVNMSAQPRPPA